MGFGYAVYFTERAKNRVIRWDPDSGDADVVAGEPPDDDSTQKLADPYGLVFDRDGYLVIADKAEQQDLSSQEWTPGTIGRYEMIMDTGSLPDTRSAYDPTLLCPTGLFLEPQGSLLCSFADDYTIYRIHVDGRLELLLGVVRNRNYAFSEFQESVPKKSISNTPIHVPTGLVERSDGTLFFIERMPQVVREYHPNRGLATVFPVSKKRASSHLSGAPARAPIAEYHPKFPGALALDLDENLYMTDVVHGCILQLDFANGEFRRVVETPRSQNHSEGGLGALAFGPDGTAWVVDSASGAVKGYQPNTSSTWTELTSRVSDLRGEPLKLPVAGSGIVTGA